MRKTIKVNATLEGLAELQHSLEECLKYKNYSLKYSKRIEIIVDEIAGNIVRYAYDTYKGKMELRMNLKRQFIKLCFVDSGIPYNPLLHQEPNIDLSVEDRNPGGLGIYMVRSFVDEIQYKRKNNKNYLFIQINII
ncbi:MAG: ATP-binding protein [Anaeroplasmataceae bacterium]|nr:ATP-binding protein [Anaeroplasmataceae bacterium]